MEFNVHNLIGIGLLIIAFAGVFLLVRAGKKYIEILEKREEKK
jgi:hypothetical protein